MPNTPSLPDSLAPFVKSVGSPVESSDVEVYDRYQAVVDRSYRTRALVVAWERQQDQDRTSRKTYAKWLMWAVSLQVVIASTAFFLIGFGLMEVTPWVASVFFGSVFAEIAGLALFVVKYLFPDSGSGAESLLDRL